MKIMSEEEKPHWLLPLKIFVGTIGCAYAIGTCQEAFETEEEKRIRYEKADSRQRYENREKGLPENWHKMSSQEQQFWLDANNRSWGSTVD